MVYSSRAVIWLFGIVGGMLAARAQTASPPIVRSNTALVQVTVAATGVHGAPVTDLIKNDFSIKEKGRSRLIAVFENYSLRHSVSAGTAVTPHFGSFSNRPRPGDNGPVTVVLLDAADSDAANWKLAWPQVVEFLRNLRPEQRIAVYSLELTSGLQVLQDYDTGHEHLMEALRKSHVTLERWAKGWRLCLMATKSQRLRNEKTS